MIYLCLNRDFCVLKGGKALRSTAPAPLGYLIFPKYTHTHMGQHTHAHTCTHTCVTFQIAHKFWKVHAKSKRNFLAGQPPPISLGQGRGLHCGATCALPQHHPSPSAFPITRLLLPPHRITHAFSSRHCCCFWTLPGRMRRMGLVF